MIYPIHYEAKIGDVKYKTLAAAVSAAEEGQTVEVLAADSYTLPGISKNITIEGAVEGVVFNHTGAGNVAAVPNGATFKNVTFNFGNNNYHGFQHAGTINMEGCTLNGKLFSYGDMNFTNCQFNQSAADYHMWVYGPSTVKYTGCEFTGKGKFLNLYREDAQENNVIVDGCTFVSDTKNKAALNVKATSGSTLLKYNVVIKNSTVNENFPEAKEFTNDNGTTGIVLNGLVQVDDRPANGAEDNITITQEETLIYPIHYVAQIGDVKYRTLTAAVAAVPADGTETTITIIANQTINVVGSAVTIPATKNIVLDLNGYQVVGTAETGATSALITNRGTLTVKDSSEEGTGALISGATTTWIYEGDGNYAGSYASNTITNTGTLTVESGLIQNISTGSAVYAVDNNSSGANAILNMNGGTLKAKSVAVRQFANSTTLENVVNVAGGTIEASNSGIWIQLPGSDATKAMKATLNVTGGTLNGSYAFYDYTYGNSFDATQYNLNGGTFNGMIFSYGANINITDGVYNGDVAIKQAKASEVTVSGGKFKGDVYTYGDNASTGFITGGMFATTTYEDEGKTYDCDWMSLLAEGLACRANTDEATKDEYPYAVGVKVELAQPIIFHDGGEYEGELTVAMAAQEGAEIFYATDGENFTQYTTPLTISATTTLTAYATMLGAESKKVEKTFTIVAKQAGPSVADGYYNIKAGDKFVNVAGRKTVTLVDDNEGMPGTVIRVKANDKGQVEVLRSQGVDLPRYAERAMSYVPELVKEVVNKLAANVDDPIIGEQGVDLILAKFNKEFDYHLYLEEVNGGYRIYGKTPSMKHVVDFYANNKEIIDNRLPKLEGFVEDILKKVAERLNHADSPWASKFKILDIWTSMGGEESNLTKPVEGDEEAISKFYTEVLSSEKNVWDFAYQTAMIYWTKVEELVNEHADQLGDYSKYLTRVKNIKPDFKYYIVVDEAGTGLDFISQGNAYLDTPRTSWTLAPRTDFNVNFDVKQEHKICPVAGGGDPITYSEYYTTLYTDFAYTLPEDGSVKAYKVVHVNDTTGVAIRKEITGTIPAQTPVMLISKTEGNKTLTLSLEDGTAVTGNLLVGADALINEYKINSPTAEGILNMLKSLSESLYNDYEYLARKNSGTVNNKYFFGLTEEDAEKCVVNKDCVIRNLSTDDNEKTAFHESWEAKANKALLVSEKFNPILLSLVGDVNRDGTITIGDVTALVNIILGKAKYPDDKDKYDFEAADVNGDSVITIGDVTKLVNIILGKE